MQQEIERKFLLKDDSFKSDLGLFEELNIVQGYLSKVSGRIVRVRTIEYVIHNLHIGILTIKVGREDGIGTDEFEYRIPLREAQQLLESCDQPILEKTRYGIKFKGVKWEVDVFRGHKSGLVMAEVELNSADQVVELPAWIGEEVTGRAEYYNANM